MLVIELQTIPVQGGQAMEGRITLSAQERKRCLKTWRYGPSIAAARHALVLLRLDGGATYREIREMCSVSFDLISAVKQRFEVDGINAVLDESRPVVAAQWWVLTVLVWLRDRTPRAFGYFQARWTCGVLALVLWEQCQLKLSDETIRRSLHRQGYVWRRPRPVVGPVDPEYKQKLRRIQRLLASLPTDETAVFQDEVDVNLNPKIGSMWMPCGEQAQVQTPGNNVKRYLCGSLLWRSNTLIVSSSGPSRNTQLFLAHLEDLRHRLRRYRKIHVICDNAKFHKSGAVQDYLRRWEHRIQLHFLPTYAPETNPIERVWWHLHETITRNHQCATMDELLTEVYDWFDTVKTFAIETSIYRIAA
jgi:transposase